MSNRGKMVKNEAKIADIAGHSGLCGGLVTRTVFCFVVTTAASNITSNNDYRLIRILLLY